MPEWDLSGLGPVSESAARAYQQASAVLTQSVDQEMSACENLEMLLGGNPPQVMYSNHSNHALFIAGILYFNDYKLLVQILPWVYRSYHARGFDYAYFPLELNAWKKAILEYLAPPMAAEIIPVYDWMLRQHSQIITAAESTPLLKASTRSAERTAQIQTLLSHLLRGDRNACQTWLTRLQSEANLSLSEIYLEILEPTMHEVGLLWEEGKISVAQEHLASALVSRLMVLIYARQNPPLPSRGKALITTAPNEFHEMGAWMLSDLLEQDGWETRYMGTNTPPEDILAWLQAEKPALVAISVSIPFNLEKAGKLIEQIRQIPMYPPPRIMLGGLALNYHERLWVKMGADGYASNAHEAVALAAKWSES